MLEVFQKSGVLDCIDEALMIVTKLLDGPNLCFIYKLLLKKEKRVRLVYLPELVAAALGQLPRPLM